MILIDNSDLSLCQIKLLFFWGGGGCNILLKTLDTFFFFFLRLFMFKFWLKFGKAVTSVTALVSCEELKKAEKALSILVKVRYILCPLCIILTNLQTYFCLIWIMFLLE